MYSLLQRKHLCCGHMCSRALSDDYLNQLVRWCRSLDIAASDSSGHASQPAAEDITAAPPTPQPTDALVPTTPAVTAPALAPLAEEVASVAVPEQQHLQPDPLLPPPALALLSASSADSVTAIAAEAKLVEPASVIHIPIMVPSLAASDHSSVGDNMSSNEALHEASLQPPQDDSTATDGTSCLRYL